MNRALSVRSVQFVPHPFEQDTLIVSEDNETGGNRRGLWEGRRRLWSVAGGGSISRAGHAAV